MDRSHALETDGPREYRNDSDRGSRRRRRGRGDGDEVVSGLGFRRVGDYLRLDPGDHDVRVTGVGDADAVIYDETLTLEAESSPRSSARRPPVGAGPSKGSRSDVTVN